MNTRTQKPAGSAALLGALDTVEALANAGTRAVPEKPTLEMLAAGSRAGGVSVETAWGIYQAMLRTAP